MEGYHAEKILQKEITSSATNNHSGRFQTLKSKWHNDQGQVKEKEESVGIMLCVGVSVEA